MKHLTCLQGNVICKENETIAERLELKEIHVNTADDFEDGIPLANLESDFGINSTNVTSR